MNWLRWLFNVPANEPRARMAVEADEIRLKVGNLTIESNGQIGRCLVDGEELRFGIQRLQVTWELDNGWQVEFEGFPRDL